MSSKPVIVLAPGAWHSPEHFQDIRDELHQRGWSTKSVRYPSVGAEPPKKGMLDDAAAVRTLLQELVDQGRQVILVAHSYGGVVCAEAVNGLGYKQRAKENKPGGVILFLYLAAFVAPKGQSILSLTNNQFTPWMRVEDGRIFAETSAEVFYGDVAAEVTERAIGLLKHQTVVSFQECVTYEPWHDIECEYFACEDDNCEQMKELLGPKAVKLHHKSSHSPFLSQVSETADVIERAAKRGQNLVEA
ncbi:hypothetical protein CCHL11_01691 [Colletotrichum chlorophyti]|uniref:AB hydrolase-1 domain-containing protein n=1 Tax=Colletotrichum chlorophyti TaxID=708187 RepID=A0A1Q8RVV6_9PEZI|nr:hypothetical protein CCHL11_01691 [Colletotrichum chlorophyti]